MLGAKKRRIVLIDQIPETLKVWATEYEFRLPPRTFIQDIIEQTLENICTHFQCRIVYISSEDITSFAKLVSPKHIGIFISPAIFYKVKKILRDRGQTYIDFKISRTRLPILNSGFFPGHGTLLGSGKSVEEQMIHIKRKTGSKSCILFDDSITTGKTMSEISALFNRYGLTVALWAPISCLLPKETLYKVQISSITRVFPKDCIEIEMKDFLNLSESGAAYPMGTQQQSNIISKIIKIIRNKSKGRVNKLEKEGIHVNSIRQFELEIKRIDSLQFPENKDFIQILQLLKIPKVDMSIVGLGRLSYLWPGYKSPRWNLSDSSWKTFSAKQHKLSVDLYRAIESRSKKRVLVRHVPIYNEAILNRNRPLCEYLLSFTKSL